MSASVSRFARRFSCQTTGSTMKREMPLHCSFHCTGLLSPNDAANPVLPYSAIYRMTAEIQLLSFPRHHCTAMNDGAMRLRVRISVHQPRRQRDGADALSHPWKSPRDTGACRRCLQCGRKPHRIPHRHGPRRPCGASGHSRGTRPAVAACFACLSDGITIRIGAKRGVTACPCGFAVTPLFPCAAASQGVPGYSPVPAGTH